MGLLLCTFLIYNELRMKISNVGQHALSVLCKILHKRGAYRTLYTPPALQSKVMRCVTRSENQKYKHENAALGIGRPRWYVIHQ